MRDVARDNRLLSFVAKSGLKNSLITMLDQLHRCQKSLNEFLEVCAMSFSRFVQQVSRVSFAMDRRENCAVISRMRFSLQLNRGFYTQIGYDYFCQLIINSLTHTVFFIPL